MKMNGYTSIKPRLLNSRFTKKVLNSYFGDHLTKSILTEVEQHYLNLINDLPFLGTQKHMNSLPLVESAYFLALCRILQTHSLPVEQIGKIYYEMFEMFLNSYPKLYRYFYSKLRYGRGYRKRYQQYALQTEQRRYPADFICTFIDGDGINFDYGYDYTECAILKYFQAHDAAELAPFFCYIDFSLAKAFQRGLTRVQTLSEGDEKCEFRYLKNRPMEVSWPPEFLKKIERVDTL